MVWLFYCNCAFSNGVATISNPSNLEVSMDVVGLLSLYMDTSKFSVANEDSSNLTVTSQDIGNLRLTTITLSNLVAAF